MISLASEMTDSKGRHARAWLFFDAGCEFCTRIAKWLAGPMQRRGLALAPLQDSRVGALLGLPQEELVRAVRYLSADGKQYYGADALLAAARELWWGQPLVWVSKIPGAMRTMRTVYAWRAQRLRCQAQSCFGESGLKAVNRGSQEVLR